MKIDGDIAELIGIHIGDGCISKTKTYSEYYLGGDIIEEKEYHNKWVGPLFNKKIMIPLFNKEVNYKEHPKVGIYGFHIFDKKLVELFEKFGVSSGSKINIGIPESILRNRTLSKRFIRGLFDTDGTLYFNRNKLSKINNRPVIKLGTVSERLADQVYELLIKNNFHPRMKKPYKGKRDKNKVHTVLLYRISDIINYIQFIGFKNPKHFTKWQVYKKLGYCPPKTNISERYKLILA